MELLTTAHPNSPALDMKLTKDLLHAVAGGVRPATIRVFLPGPTLAFGQLDRHRDGFDHACRTAEAHGRTPVVRLGGGHAVAYDGDCLVIEVIRRQGRREVELESRFVDMVELISGALASLGVSVWVGERSREYCPGKFSLHLPNGPKVAGVAQRVILRGSLTTAVVVVGGGDALRAVVGDVYAALELPLDLRTVGAVADTHPELNCDIVRRAVIARLVGRYR